MDTHLRNTLSLGGTGMRLTVDRARCEGHGMCESVAPELLHLDDDGELVIDQEAVPVKNAEEAQDAVHVCPVAALTLEE